ncbi:thrombospondin type 3 repeat-containing protein [Candidatus Parcubacteria bacterium]|nr:thrombospondin type 3 repeat-containing protein [Patescibacteria group bacterium]MBU4482396.1 thrombospondin type 3 repeat-containing protein [Patescibacteria group bacterium]MCG2687005.1 thrombospondin type 3 repeat-containing protein [Candidatus Parcubacteria bacterium]
MFETNKKQLSGNKGPVEDILADTDSAFASHSIENSLKNATPVNEFVPEPQSLKETLVVPSMQQKTRPEAIKPINLSQSTQTQSLPTAPNARIGKSRNKLFLIIIIVFIVIIFGLASVFAYQYFTRDNADELDTTSQESFQELLDVLDEKQEDPAQSHGANSEDELYFEKDSDGDGLTDNIENELGTDPQKFDTDNDGLNDFEEIQIYFSDPLNPDTDGDSYLDGEEVENNYSPLRGDGAKL